MRLLDALIKRTKVYKQAERRRFKDIQELNDALRAQSSLRFTLAECGDYNFYPILTPDEKLWYRIERIR